MPPTEKYKFKFVDELSNKLNLRLGLVVFSNHLEATYMWQLQIEMSFMYIALLQLC